MTDHDYEVLDPVVFGPPLVSSWKVQPDTEPLVPVADHYEEPLHRLVRMFEELVLRRQRSRRAVTTRHGAQ